MEYPEKNTKDAKPIDSKENIGAHTNEPEKAQKRTFGNKLYDFLVFAPIAWGGVWMSSAATGYQALHGTNKNFNWLRTMNKNVGEWIHKTLSKTVMKNSSPENIKGMAENLGFTFILGMGSHFLVGPIKWLEDHRQSNAAKIDKIFGTTPPDNQAIKQEPKQNWASVISGRMASWATAFVALAAMGPKFTKKLNDGFGTWATNKWMSFRPADNKIKVNRWANLLAFDALGTIITASVTYVFSRFVAEHFGKKSKVADTVYELNPVAPNPFGDDGNNKNSRNFAQGIIDERNSSQNINEPNKTGRKTSVVEQNVAFTDRVKNEEHTGHVRV